MYVLGRYTMANATKKDNSSIPIGKLLFKVDNLKNGMIIELHRLPPLVIHVQWHFFPKISIFKER